MWHWMIIEIIAIITNIIVQILIAQNECVILFRLLMNYFYVITLRRDNILSIFITLHHLAAGNVFSSLN